MLNNHNGDTAKKLQQLEAAVNASSDIIYITDSEGRINYVNSAFEKITGWRRHEVIGKHPSFMENPQSTTNPNTEIWKSLSQRKTWTGRLQNQRKNSTGQQAAEQNTCSDSLLYWVHATITPILEQDGSVSGYISIQRDVTIQVTKETQIALEVEIDRIRTRILEALQQDKPLQERLDRVLDILFVLQGLGGLKRGAVYIQLDDRDHFELISIRGNFNDSFAKTHNRYSIEECNIEPPDKLHSVSYTECCSCDGLIDSQHGHFTIPLTHAGTLLGILLFFTNKEPVKSPIYTAFWSQLGSTIGLALADEQLRKELTKARNTAMETVRIRSEFLSNISHELRTPINGIQGMLSLLGDSNLDDEQAMLVGVANEAASELLGLVNDVLDFSELDTERMQIVHQEFNLREMVQKAIEGYHDLAKHRDIVFEINIDKNAPINLYADASRIKQNLGHYISNAIKFSENGTITTTVEYLMEPNGDYLKFFVADEGIGISSENHSALFQSFKQGDGSSKRKYGGVGLGLAIVSKLTEMMGGQCGVNSELGQGSTFWFTVLLPQKHQYRSLKLVDEQAFNQLRSAMGDDFNSVKATFLAEIGELIDQCEDSLKHKDDAKTRRILRSIVTSSKEIGAIAMFNAIEELEANLGGKNFEDCWRVLQEIRLVHERLAEYFKTEAA